MTVDGFFRWVWRFNALAIAGVAVIGGLLGMAALFFLIRDLTQDRYVPNLVNVSPEAEPSTREKIGGFSPLGSTGLLWAPIERGSETALRISSKYASAVIDYLIYEPETGQTRPLLGLPRSMIVETRHLYAPGPRPEASPPLALLVLYVTEDTDGDERLTAADAQQLALAAPDGTGLAALARITANHGINTISAREAVAMVESGQGLEALHLDLAGRTIAKREAVRR